MWPVVVILASLAAVVCGGLDCQVSTPLARGEKGQSRVGEQHDMDMG